jgi:hypothetical protein
VPCVDRAWVMDFRDEGLEGARSGWNSRPTSGYAFIRGDGLDPLPPGLKPIDFLGWNAGLKARAVISG